MHGRVQRDRESCRSLRRSSSQHMRSVLPSATTNNTVAVAGDNRSPPASSITTSPSGDSFFKDSRKISVGDCALFRPAKDSPPFIGLIRWLALNKENNLQLGVNWLYRSSELKLGKGSPVDSAPNEIFYSFHKDEIPAASLLHPCKVAFLPRGVELPTGASSFVCRRAYDIANKCLRWLTDQDYNNQEEVNQLLSKTETEMHVTLQPGGRSPKQVNGPTSTSQLKPASDSGQNSGTSFPSQPKGKKRERGDHGADAVKRERSSSRTDDGDSVQCKTETNLKNEIARITDKGGVVDLEGVEKLVQLMQLDRKMDLLSRSMLASVMASTDKVDCLNRFVQLRGLPILDEWMQDIHKGKIGDGNNLKGGDKSVEEFLLVLLRALDKLPVNLQALQTCNIGRSVNHLRSHKNVEIQRKARTLVDTWKKRVEAEMISNDAKSGSTQAAAGWPSKSRLQDASYGGSRTPSGSDVAVKSSISQNSAAKTASVRSSHGESSIKYATSSPGSVKPAASVASGKESQPGTSVGGTADAPQIREDRSSSSNQSHNYGQSCSAKEDVKSYTSGSVTVNKTSTSSTRNRKVSGFPGTSATGSHKEVSSSKIASAQKSSASEKLSHSALTTSERVVEGPISEGSSHKLIVKIPNRGRSPAQGMSGGSLEDPTFMSSRASSPVLSNKHEQSDHASKDKNDAYRCNVASDMIAWQTNDPKDALTRSEGAESPAIPPDEEQSMTTEDSKRIIEGLPTNQLKSVKSHASSFSPMNALIESCVKYSEATSSLSLEDDVGMNLLASVAAGEMSRLDVVSPTDSTERSIHGVEEVCTGDEAKSKSAPEEYTAGVQNQFHSESHCDGKKDAVLDGCLWSDDGSHLSKHAPVEYSGDRKCAPSHSSEDIAAGEGTKDFGPSSTDLRRNSDHKLETVAKPNEKTDTTSSAPPISVERVRDGESNEGTHEDKATLNVVADSISNRRNGGFDVMVTEEKSSTECLSIGECKPMVEVVESKPLDESGCTKFVNEGLNRITNSEEKLTAAIVKSEFAETANYEKLHQAECGQISPAEAGDAVRVGKLDDGDANSCMSKSERLNFDKEVDGIATDEGHTASVSCSTSHDLDSYHIDANVGKQEIPEHISVPASRSPGLADGEAQKEVELTGSVSASMQADEAGKCASTGAGAVSSSAAAATYPDAKLKFDLNEGLSADDGKYGESVTSTSSGPTTVHVINSLPFSLNSIPSGHSASVTIAAAAKGPFVPPEDLLRSRVELGWKGSAATSAFRPAEPRKVLETPLAQTNFSSADVSTSKHDRIPLDIDLNVPDERVLEEMASRGSALAVDSTSDSANNCATLLNEASDSLRVRGGGGLDLDLNRVDDANDIGHSSTRSNHNGEASTVHVKPLGGLHARRDFDLNDGPVGDDASAEQFPFINQLVRGGMMSQLPSSGLRMNSPVLGSFSSWFPPGNTYSTVAISSVLPDRGEQPFSVFPPGAPQRTFGPAGVAPFNPDVYRGSVLSSSPAVPYPSSPFQIPLFPFGTTFPLPSATFPVGATSYADSLSAARPFAPPVNSQYLGPVGSVTSQFQRPYVVSLPDIGTNSGLEGNKQWGRQGLDLNTGPGAIESEVREEMLPLSSGQHSVASSQGLLEEQARMFSVSGGLLKRKEPDGGWDNENFRLKQSSWQ